MEFENVYVIHPDGSRYGPADIPTLIEWARQGRVPFASLVEDAETHQMRPVNSVPELKNEIPRDLFQKLIPPNTLAVIGYYVAILSLLGALCLFIPTGIGGLAAVILGGMGLRSAKRDPDIRGVAHAWTAIILGSLEVLALLAVGIMIFLAQ
ncbi:hypothetical protein KQI84_03885 [bacterium]|nr:hypothetical protein [bacterium]